MMTMTVDEITEADARQIRILMDQCHIVYHRACKNLAGGTKNLASFLSQLDAASGVMHEVIY